MQLSATVLSGLSSDVAFPVQLSGSTGTWMTENGGSDVAAVDAVYGQRTLSPKIYQATTSYSRKLLAQSSLDIEAFVRNDLALAHATAIDAAAINGSGSANQPLGLLKTTGIGSVVIAANGGGVVTAAKITDLETAISDANADEAQMSFLTTPKQRGVMKKNRPDGLDVRVPPTVGTRRSERAARTR